VDVDSRSTQLTRATLGVQWRNALALTTGGVLLLSLAAVGLLYAGSGGAARVVSIGTAVVGIVFLAIAGRLISVVGQGERRLREAGLRWKVDRSLVGSERRTLELQAPWELVRAAALETLGDDRFGLEDIRQTRRGARALWPGERGGPLDLLLTRWPLEVRAETRSRGAATRLRVSVQLVQVWVSWPTLSASVQWVADAQQLADGVADGISARVKGGAS
jgi:hypothetical protein